MCKIRKKKFHYSAVYTICLFNVLNNLMSSFCRLTKNYVKNNMFNTLTVTVATGIIYQ